MRFVPERQADSSQALRAWLCSLDISQANRMPSNRAQTEGLRSSKIFKWPSSDVPKRDRRDACASFRLSASNHKALPVLNSGS
jgi:hypothetical protein